MLWILPSGEKVRRWGEVSHRRNAPVMLDQASVPWFVELNRSLQDRLDDEAFRQRMREATSRLHVLARELLQRARADHPGLDGSELLDVLAQRADDDTDTPELGRMLFPAPAEAAAS